MKRCLVDVNVWVALLHVNHEHHRIAVTWFDTLSASEAVICRFVELSVARLLANSAVMGNHVVNAGSAWNAVQTLRDEERMQFVAEPQGIEMVLPTLLTPPNASSRFISDAYLAAFAIQGSYRFVTLDRGFRQFRALDVEVLRH